MVTTIQLNEGVKKDLNRLKTEKQTYEEAIINLMKIAEEQKRNHEALLIEGCEEMSDESLKITNEFEAIEDGWEW